MKLILAIIAACFLFTSCKVTKYVDREVVKVDSSVIEQNEGLQRALQETIESYEKQRESWEKTGIVFDTLRQNDTVVINKVVFDNGKIKSAEGRIRAINTELFEKSSELLDAYSLIDSLSFENERKEAQLSKVTEKEVIKIKRVPAHHYWLYLLAFLLGLAAEYRFKILKRILSLKIRL